HPEEPTSVTCSTSSTDKVDNRRPRTPRAHPSKASTQQEGPPRHVTVRTGQGRRRTRHPSHVAPTHRRCTPCPAGRTCDPCGQPPCADRPALHRCGLSPSCTFHRKTGAFRREHDDQEDRFPGVAGP